MVILNLKLLIAALALFLFINSTHKKISQCHAFSLSGEASSTKNSKILTSSVAHHFTASNKSSSIRSETKAKIDHADGCFRIRPLMPDDAEYVNSRWPYKSSKSLCKIKRQIIEAGNVIPPALSPRNHKKSRI